MPFDWTPERVALLKTLWLGGIPTGEIGRKLGTSRRSVIGKARRLGLPKHANISKRKYSDTFIRAIAAMQRDGNSRKQIEIFLNLPPSFWNGNYYRRAGKI